MPQVCLLISSNSRTSSWYWLSRVTCTCISLISSSHLNLKGVINNIPHSFPFLGMPKLAPASHDKWAAKVIWLVICNTVQTKSWHNCSFSHCFKIRSKPRRKFKYGWFYLVSGCVCWYKPTSLPKIFLCGEPLGCLPDGSDVGPVGESCEGALLLSCPAMDGEEWGPGLLQHQRIRDGLLLVGEHSDLARDGDWGARNSTLHCNTRGGGEMQWEGGCEMQL